MNKPLLTIYSPIFNHSDIIEDNLSEIANQTRKLESFDKNKIEIVLSDNCSTDNTEEKIRKFVKNNQDLNILYSRNDENVGGIQNILDCSKKSSGKYIIMIGDDHIAKNGLQNIIETILDSNDADFILIKNNTYTDFEYISDATTDDIMRNIDKIGFIGNFIFKKDFFFTNFKNYDAALKNFYPHILLILEKISSAKKVIDTRFVAINIGDSWNYQRQTKKVFQLLIDKFVIAYLMKDFLEKKHYNYYLKVCNKSLYRSLRFMRWYKDRFSLSIFVMKHTKTKSLKVLIGLFIYSLPAPLFYLFKIVGTSIKYIKQCLQEMIENRKMWKEENFLKTQNYTGYQ